MFKSAETLRLAAEMRALQRVASPWRESRTTWFDGTPESIEARLASTERVLSFARAGMTTAHMALEREAATARAELREASHRLMTDFLDDGARVAGKHDADPDEPWKNQATGEDTPTEHWENLHLSPFDDVDDYEGKHRESNRRVAAFPEGAPWQHGHPESEHHIRTAPWYHEVDLNDGEAPILLPNSNVLRELGEYRLPEEANPFNREMMSSRQTAAGDYPLGPGYDRPGFGPGDIAEYEDYLHEHDYHTDPTDRRDLERRLHHEEPDFDDPARYSSRKTSYYDDDLYDEDGNHVGPQWPEDLKHHLTGDPARKSYDAGYAASWHDDFSDHPTPWEAAKAAFDQAGGFRDSQSERMGGFDDGWTDAASDIPHKFDDPAGWQGHFDDADDQHYLHRLKGEMMEDHEAEVARLPETESPHDLMRSHDAEVASLPEIDHPTLGKHGRRTAAPMTSVGEGGSGLADMGPAMMGNQGGAVSTSLPGAIAKGLWNGSTTTGQEPTPAFNPGPKSASLRLAAAAFIDAQNTRDRDELAFRAARHVAGMTGQLPRPIAEAAGRAFVAAVLAGCDCGKDQGCDDCGAESGESCRPWCTGEAAHEDEKADRKKKSHRTAALTDFADELMF